MVKSFVGALLFAIVATAATTPTAKDAFKPTPFMRTVTPAEARVGDTLTITGENLDKTRVDAIYLTAGEDSYRLEIISQTDTKIVTKVSEKVKPGRLRMMVLTVGEKQQFLEQPLMIVVK